MKPWGATLAALLVALAARSQAPNLEEARRHDASGVALAEAGRIAEALEQFRAALLAAPEFPEAHYHLALAHDRMGHTDEAMSEFEETLRLRGDFIQARYLLAACCRKRGDFEGETRVLAEVVKRAPDFAEAHYNYGLALQREEKPAEAVEQLRAAARLDARNPRYAMALGVALAERDRAAAVAALRHAVELAPNDADTHYNLALAMAGAGNDAGAVAEFEAVIRLNADHSNARRGLGVSLMHLDRLKESAAQLKRAKELAPGDAEAANNLGLVLLRLQDIAGAVAALERAVNLNPKLIKAHFSLAQAYQRAGRSADARAETRRAQALTAEQRSLGRAMVLTQDARQRLAAGDAAAAIAALRDAITQSPAFADAHLELGRAILRSAPDPSEAVQEFRRTWNLDPERAEAHYLMGLALQKTGDQARAIDELKSAVSMAPCRVEMMRALARAALAAGDRATATRLFRRVLAWDAEDKEARANAGN